MEPQFIQEALQYLKSISQGVNNPWTIWASFSSALIALIIGLLGVFRDRVRSLFIKPKLKVSIKTEPPDCHKTSMAHPATGKYLYDTYYFRFRIDNIGNCHAEDVEAMVTEVHKKINGQYKKKSDFLPLNLLWSHYRKITMEKIQPKLFKHLDFGFILKRNFVNLKKYGIEGTPNVVFQFDVAVKPNTGSHILLPGNYKVKIVFAASNFKPIEKTYNLEIKDKWDNNEEKMLAENILIKENCA